MSQVIGYVVLAKRPDIRNEGAFVYEAAGGVHSTVAPCENHQAYCQMAAERDPERYGDVEYVIAALRAHVDAKPPEGYRLTDRDMNILAG